ncbi:MAG: VanZ family protein [Planctomycetota bacterium]
MARAEQAAPEVGGFLAQVLQALGRLLQRIPRSGAVALAVAWGALIWYASSRPAPAIGPVGAWGEMLGNLAHAPEYGVLVVWIALALPRRDGWPDLAPRSVCWILVVAGLYAVLDEIHQSFTPDRDASVFDLLTDLVGASATLACIVAAGGARASPKDLRKRLVLGLLACVLAAALATFGSDAWPNAAWV